MKNTTLKQHLKRFVFFTSGFILFVYFSEAIEINSLISFLLVCLGLLVACLCFFRLDGERLISKTPLIALGILMVLFVYFKPFERFVFPFAFPVSNSGLRQFVVGSVIWAVFGLLYFWSVHILSSKVDGQ